MKNNTNINRKSREREKKKRNLFGESCYETRIGRRIAKIEKNNSQRALPMKERDTKKIHVSGKTMNARKNERGEHGSQAKRTRLGDSTRPRQRDIRIKDTEGRESLSERTVVATLHGVYRSLEIWRLR